MQLIITAAGEMNLNFGDDLVVGTCIGHKGKIVNEKIASMVETVPYTALN